ncbi:MAG: metallopeptidase TldD-related protein [Chloroflexota bacterium]
MSLASELTADDLRTIATAAVAAALDAGASDADALGMGGHDELTRFANNEIHQNVAETSASVNLRVVVGRRVGVATGDRLDPDGLAQLARDAVTIARLQPEREDEIALAPAQPIVPVAGTASDATASATPEERAEAVRAIIAAAEAAGVVAAGSYRTTTELVAVATSRGVAAAERRTLGHALTVMMSPDGGTGYAEAAAVDHRAIDAPALGREAAAKARAMASPVALPAGDHPVVLEQYAVLDLLDFLAYLGLSGLAVEEERSFAEPGRVIGSPLVTIRDDATDPAGAPASFDYEGVPKRPLMLVEGGVCREVAWDTETAARAGRASTGHGLPPPNPYGPFPMNLVMDAGSASHEELVGGMEHGLLVTRFHYTNVVHPKLAIITGMTRDGLFLVEDGRIVGPVRNLRFTQSYLDALAGVEAVGAERRLLRGMMGPTLVPSVRIGSFAFTGVTEH